MLRIVQMGLGSIGRAIAQRVQRQSHMELVGAADPAEAGRDLGEIIGTGRSGVEVVAALEEDALDRMRPNLVLHATGSYLGEVARELEPLLERGISVVSTCEELAYPLYRHPELAHALDAAARRSGAVLLGSGVNPGFVMDKLVVTLMAACDSVSSVRVTRVVDAARRRESFQRKVGAGLAPSAFEERRAAGRIGHVGLAETAHMLADAMGVPAEREVREELHPVLAARRVASEHVTVEVGQVAGIHHTAVLEAGGRTRVELELEMVIGAGRPRDAVSIEGSPPLEMEVASGVPGDEGTAAIVVNCARLVRGLAPGLRTMLDVPLRPGGI